jgi:hypothetical protein
MERQGYNTNILCVYQLSFLDFNRESMSIYKTNHLGKDVAVQFQYGSGNSKTGSVVQVWIIPFAWIERGKEAMNDDTAVCMDCVHSIGNGKSCYVRKGYSNVGLMSKVKKLHKDYVSGALEVMPIDKLAENEKSRCRGKFVRFGSYGEPVLLGEDNVRAIASKARGFAGYTHQWYMDNNQWASEFFMASVETEALMLKAHGKGWRTFRVRKRDEPIGREVSCPASKEMGRLVTCDVCGLCSGNKSKAKSVTIIKH